MRPPENTAESSGLDNGLDSTFRNDAYGSIAADCVKAYFYEICLHF